MIFSLNISQMWLVLMIVLWSGDFFKSFVRLGDDLSPHAPTALQASHLRVVAVEPPGFSFDEAQVALGTARVQEAFVLEGVQRIRSFQFSFWMDWTGVNHCQYQPK